MTKTDYAILGWASLALGWTFLYFSRGDGLGGAISLILFFVGLGSFLMQIGKDDRPGGPLRPA